MALTRPGKLHFAGFLTKMFKVSLTHIISACPNSRKKQYNKRHDKVAKKIHQLWKKFHLACNDKRYQHVPDSALEDPKPCEIFLTKLPQLLNIGDLILYVLTKQQKAAYSLTSLSPENRTFLWKNQKRQTSTKICVQNWGNYAY